MKVTPAGAPPNLMASSWAGSNVSKPVGLMHRQAFHQAAVVLPQAKRGPGREVASQAADPPRREPPSPRGRLQHRWSCRRWQSWRPPTAAPMRAPPSRQLNRTDCTPAACAATLCRRTV
eukprot:4406106-Pleurochrysis_carterae.AAC.2